VIGLEWPQVNVLSREIRIAKAISGGEETTPKSGHGRTVDISTRLAETLARLELDRKLRHAARMVRGTTMGVLYGSRDATGRKQSAKSHGPRAQECEAAASLYPRTVFDIPMPV